MGRGANSSSTTSLGANICRARSGSIPPDATLRCSFRPGGRRRDDAAFRPADGAFHQYADVLPMFILMFILPYTGHGRDEAGSARAPRFSLSGAIQLMRETSANPTILSMILLGGATSLLVGNAFQAQMPEFAHDFGHDKQDVAYSMLLGANAAGAVVGGLLLEGRGLLRAERAQRGDLLDSLVCWPSSALPLPRVIRWRLHCFFARDFSI